MSDQKQKNTESTVQPGISPPIPGSVKIWRINDAGTGWEPVNIGAELDEIIKSHVLAKPRDVDRHLRS